MFFRYYAPLTSPKQKHLQMKNQVDFLKINNGVWGAINFNNMLPIHNKSLQQIVIKIRSSDTRTDVNYKNLLVNQLSWCNVHKDVILKHANKLYDLIVQKKGRQELIDRCCDFPVDEKQYYLYCKEHHFEIPK